MTVPTHFRFTFRGIFGSTTEAWMFSCKFDRDVVAGPDAELGDINNAAVTAAVTALLGTAGPSGFSSAAILTDWRAYVIGTDGRMQGNPKQVDVTPGAIHGTTTNPYPPNIALCVTTVGPNRGPARFGRFYLPGPSAPLGTDMRMSSASAQGYGAAAATFLKAISSAIDLPGTIASSAGLNISDSPAGVGTKQAIDHVEVGRVFDQLETRRHQLDEAREIRAHIDW